MVTSDIQSTTKPRVLGEQLGVSRQDIFRTMKVKSVEEATRFIPVIDVGPAFRGEAGGLEAVASAVRNASENVGFFYLAGHGVPEDVVDAAFQASREFHALPLEEKLRIAVNENNIGYLGLRDTMQADPHVNKAIRPNYNESFFISHDRSADHPDVIAGTPLRGRNQWPAGHEGMRAKMMMYFKTIERVAEKMLSVMARALDVPADYFMPFFENEAHINLRFLHYPPMESDDGEQFGQGPHVDRTFITILAREDVPGIAVRLPNGEWLAPPVIPGTFLVNLGNVIKRWSNDRFLSTPHGVVNESGKDRYSIAFFYSPNPTAVIECLPTCVGPDNPSRYPRALWGDLVLEFYNREYAGAEARRR